MILSLYDITGIQPYIFGSNRLKEILGASQLVHRALDDDLEAAMKGAAGVSKCWSGGGNAVLVSRDISTARGVATCLGAALYEHAPGLGLICCHKEWDGQSSTFGHAYQKAQRRLREMKHARWPEAAFDGAGVTALCTATGELATPSPEPDEPGRWLSPSIQAKLSAADAANSRLQDVYTLPEQYAYTKETNKLGRTQGERSFVGVVHFDGNRMGARFEDAAKQPDAMARLQKLSKQVNEAGNTALRDTLAWVEKNLPELTKRENGGFALAETDGRKAFPVRPIVFGGDDITLICDGRIALDIAASLLARWQARSREHLGETAHGCAGVALVKSHYPLHRAYEIAEGLCQAAKKAIRELGFDASALDFEIHTGGPMLSLEAARERDQAAGRRDGARNAAPLRLHARPYFVGDPQPQGRAFQSWAWFRDKLLRPLQEEQDWAEFHTQLRGLAPVLHEGRDAARIHLRRWRDRFKMELPAPPGSPLAREGFEGDRTPYLDAIELLDLIVPPRCLPTPPEGVSS